MIQSIFCQLLVVSSIFRKFNENIFLHDNLFLNDHVRHK